MHDAVLAVYVPVVLNRTLYVPHRFHPAYSLLGRWLQRRLGDTRQAEAFYLLALTGLLLVLLLGQYLAWAFLQPTITAAPTGPTALIFWLAQVGGLGLCVALCIVGFKPGVTVSVTDEAVHLSQGDRSLTVPFATVTAARTISALRFHRHYARYAATQVFVSRLPDEVLLFETADAPIIVGLAPDDRVALLHVLDAQHIPAFSRSAARVA